jgi:hypothetical protein
MNRGQQFSLKKFLHSIPLPENPVTSSPPSDTSKRKRKAKSAPPTPAPTATPKKPYKKKKISAALREQVWVQHSGRVFERKCMVTWCTNTITVFDFQCGHDIPESKGGATDITNLYPICGKCNLSMSNTYTFKEWCKLYNAIPTPPPPSPPPPPLSPPPPPKKKRGVSRYFSCFTKS